MKKSYFAIAALLFLTACAGYNVHYTAMLPMEYTVIKENGDTITVVQNMNKGDTVIAVGTRVIVQTSGSYQRVLPATNLPTKIKRPKGITFEEE